MPNLTAANVALTIPRNYRTFAGFLKFNFVKCVFGNAALLYPSGGIPLPAFTTAANKALFGLHDVCIAIGIIEPPIDGYLYKIDHADWTIRIFQNGGFTPSCTITFNPHTHDILSKKSITQTYPFGADATPHLGHADGTADITILGANSATNGGVMATTETASISGSSVAAGPLVEVSTSFVPALAITMLLQVVGK